MQLNQITKAQAWAIATVLNQACMDVEVRDHHAIDGSVDGPFFRGATGTQVLAAVTYLIREGGALAEGLAEVDWLTVSFEERRGTDGSGFSSAELGWK